MMYLDFLYTNWKKTVYYKDYNIVYTVHNYINAVWNEDKPSQL